MHSTDILNIFREQHRLCSPLDIEADPKVVLTFESTIDKWRSANDLLGWRKLYVVLNYEFNISATEQEWKSVLIPSSRKTLKDVCDLIAQKLLYRNNQEVKILEKEESSSITIYSKLLEGLKRMKIDTSGISPSTLISPYLDKYFGEMIGQITIISKGKKIFDQFELEKENIFEKNNRLLTGDIKTFHDLTMKISEVNQSFT